MQESNEITIIAPPGTTYASFSRRATAFSVDQLILLLIVIILTVPVFILLGVAAMFAWPFIVFVPTFCSVRVPVGWAYFALQESGPHQATLGKRLCGLRVTDMQGRRISFFRATVRYFMKFVSAAIMMIGFIMAAFTERHQTLHDIIADTLVLKKTKG